MVLGLGYVGLTTALGLAKLGHEVVGYEIDPDRAALVSSGEVPFFEPGLRQLLGECLESGHFSVSTDILDRGSFNFYFICVPTPKNPNTGSADLTTFWVAIESVVSRDLAESIIVLKSTIPLGTGDLVSARVEGSGIRVASNPEFLAEGTALDDFFTPHRIVVGGSSKEVAETVLVLYESINAPKISTTLLAAEMTKYASNAFLALRLSFINELSVLSEMVGADFRSISLAMGLDPRIGERYKEPGPGWGGSCFPKDTASLLVAANQAGFHMRTVAAAIESNAHHIDLVANQISESVRANGGRKKVAIWGLSFKAGTSDTRDSPALAVASKLLSRGFEVSAFDPMVSKLDNESVRVTDSPISACQHAAFLVVLTDWPDFSTIDPNVIGEVMEVRSVLDTRNVLSQDEWRQAGFDFSRIRNTL